MKNLLRFQHVSVLAMLLTAWLPSVRVMADEYEEYQAALDAIAPDAEFRIFTQFDGTAEGTQKYYLTSDGYLSPSEEEAYLFLFSRTNSSELYFSPGWQLDIPFTNPVVTNDGRGEMVLNGHIQINTRAHIAWEGQVWFKRGDRYAVRSTNANSDTWGANTYWNVTDNDADGLPEADYGLSPQYVWQLEESNEPKNNIAIDATNFPDEIFRDYLLSQSYGADGQLSEREISKITSIDVANLGIQSLQGIEFLTALTLLYCYNNQLTSLDVSANTELEYLYCDGNQLQSLNVSNNMWLITLSCPDNQLTSLDVSANTELRSLYCGGNQLQSLNVTNNMWLITLNCARNQLAELDVTNNTNLQNLNCYSNQLSSLDVSNNASLTGIYCYYNQIGEASMDALMASLPSVNVGKIYVMVSDDDYEGNVCLPEHVKAANKKGWIVYQSGSSGWSAIITEKVLITDVAQLSSPYSDSDEGYLARMIDNDPNTFWHSDWHGGSVEPGLHYFQVEMPEMDDTEFIRFKYTRRNVQNDQTVLWGVYGTDDFDAAKEECTLLGTIDMPFSNPTETITSNAFTHQGYKYLRFYSEYQGSNAGNGARGFFHLAEFQLYPVKELITDVAQLSSPYSDPDEGALDGLIDKNISTFWHSDWHGGSVVPGTHYLQVEMPDMDGMDFIKFQFTRRNVNDDHTTLWSVYGTDAPDAAKASCTKLGDFSTPFSSKGETLASDPFQHYNYKYLRFYSEEQTGINDFGSRGFFHLAEFQLYPVAGTQDTEPGDPSCLVINEIQVANIDQFIDPSFNYGGWIEIYNPSSKAIDLGNFHVSNDPNELTKFQLPGDIGKIKPRGYLTIWFDHHDVRGGNTYSSVAYRQVDWKLTYEGGEVFLSDANGTLLTSQSYPIGVQRCSYARVTDGADEWTMCSTPTPGASNDGSTFASSQLAAPEVDRDACVFTSGFDVHVAIPDGCTLCYTTDGSTPTLDNGFQTTDGHFHVDDGATTVYRFRLFGDGYLPSPVVTRTYIYKDKDYYLPIISVVTDDANLYDDTIGAYTTGTNGTTGNGRDYNINRNRGWERPVNFEYLVPEPDGGSFLMRLNQECDFEVCGGWTRNGWTDKYGWIEGQTNASFRLKANKYNLGQNFLPYSFYEDKPYIKVKGLHVRNGGNDYHARIKDAGLHEIIIRSGFYTDCQTMQPAHVFINGQYMMMFNIREPNNKNHGYSNYGIDMDAMDQFEINGSLGYEQKTGTDEAFKRWWRLTRLLAADPTNESIYNQICELVDIDEFCNYMAAEVLVGCSDWLSNSNNVKGYRSAVDGKFHLVFMDVDAGFNNSNMLSSLQNTRYYDKPNNVEGVNYLNDILFNMLEYEPFKKKFVDAFCIVDGSVFEPTFSGQVFNELVERAAPAMAMEGLEGDLYTSANNMLGKIRDYRSSRMYNMRTWFGLPAAKKIKFAADIDCASFTINGQPVPRAQFDGQLHAPATITAMAPAGYRFAGWKQAGGQVVAANETQVFDLTGESWQFYDGPETDEIADRSWLDPSVSVNWSSGLSPFGYGSIGWNTTTADYQTTLQAYRANDATYNSSSNKYPSYYFRKTFNISGTPSDDNVYTLTCYVDDGCVIYVNGNEIGRHLMPDGTPYYGQYSTTYVEHVGQELSYQIPTEYLRSGENLIAVEVHNTSASSSDIYWTAMLKRYVPETTTNGNICDTPELDIDDVADGITLTATFERVDDADLMAELAMPVRVNEISAANSVFVNEHFKKDDWFELYNTTDSPIDAAGLYLSDDIEDPLKYQIPASTVASTIIPAHGHLIVWADKLAAVTQMHTPFKLGNGNREVLLVTSSDEFEANNNQFFAAHPTLRSFADGLVYSTHRGDQSVGRYPDGGNDYFLMNLPTIEKTNTHLSFDQSMGTDHGVMENVNRKAVLDLAQGWNWVSHPLTESISVNTFKDKASVIQSQTLEARYSSATSTMAGSLRQLEAGRLYKIQMDEAGRYEIDGRVLFNQPPLALRAGWNWIGFYGTAPQTLAEAFDADEVDEGDVIVGQSGFSEFVGGEWAEGSSQYEENGWAGQLSSLTPGQGYMYKSARAKGLHIKVKSATLRLRRDAGRVGRDSYGVDRHAYPNVMGVVATLQLDGNDVDTEGITVLAYADGECRGYGRAIDGRLFLTFYGNGGEQLTLKAAADDGTEFPIIERLDFAADVQGSFRSPMVLHLGEATHTGIDATPDTARRTDASPVGYYSLNGSFLGNNATALRPGIYVVRMSDASTRKLLVR